MAGSYRHGVRRRFIVVAWAFAVFVASLLVATPALADDYSIPPLGFKKIPYSLLLVFF